MDLLYGGVMKVLGKVLLAIFTLGCFSVGFSETESKWDKYDWKDSKEGRSLTDYKYGPRSYEGKIFPELLIQGPLRIRDVKVGGSTVVYGPISSRGSELNTLKVYGPTKLIETKILGWTNVRGPLKAYGATFTKQLDVRGSLLAEETSFAGDVSVMGKTVELTDCTLKNIVFKARSKKGSKLYLSGKTVVEGNITFRGKVDQCEVYIDPSCTIKGEIVGATIIRKSK